MRKVQLTIKQEEVAPATTSDLVVMSHGKTLKEELSTNVLDKFSREVTVDTSMSKVIDGTLDGAYESLVFKGKSLVNVAQPFDRGITDVWATIHLRHSLLKQSTKYYYQVFDLPSGFQHVFTNSDGSTFLGTYTTNNISTFTTNLELTSDRIVLHINDGGKNALTQEQLGKIKVMVIEYQQGMENWDIPFFTGLCDVKMPILRNTGKNLFDIEKTLSISGKRTVALGDGSLQFPQSSDRTYLTISGGTFKENTPYTVRYDKVSGQCRFYFVYTDNTEGEKALNNSTSDPNKTLKYLRNDWSDGSTSIIKNIQIEEGSVTTTYEDHKTNILRTSEEIVLREVNGVQDTYNPLTGEYVKRIGEVVITSAVAKSVIVLDENVRVNIAMSTLNGDNGTTKSNNTLSDKFNWSEANARDIEGLRVNGNTLHWCISRDKLTSQDLQGVNTWLQSNPITVQYELAEPITTIVEPLTIPFAYENGHIILESGFEGQSLLPELKYSAPASKSGVLSTTSKAILKHEQRLHKFEDLLLRESILMDYRLMLTMLDSM